jgi:hypothetical protein
MHQPSPGHRAREIGDAKLHHRQSLFHQAASSSL